MSGSKPPSPFERLSLWDGHVVNLETGRVERQPARRDRPKSMRLAARDHEIIALLRKYPGASSRQQDLRLGMRPDSGRRRRAQLRDAGLLQSEFTKDSRYELWFTTQRGASLIPSTRSTALVDCVGDRSVLRLLGLAGLGIEFELDGHDVQSATELWVPPETATGKSLRDDPIKPQSMPAGFSRPDLVVPRPREDGRVMDIAVDLILDYPSVAAVADMLHWYQRHPWIGVLVVLTPLPIVRDRVLRGAKQLGFDDWVHAQMWDYPEELGLGSNT